MHLGLVALHAVTALAAFLAGWLSLRSGHWMLTHRWMLGIAIGSLVALVAWDWTSLPTALHVTFVGLILLGVAMIWQSGLAARHLRAPGPVARLRALPHLSFTMISLFDAFCIIGILDLGGPWWLTVIAGTAAVAAGQLVAHRVTGRLQAQRLSRSAPIVVSSP